MKNFDDIYEKICTRAKKPLEEIRKAEIKKRWIVIISTFIVFIFSVAILQAKTILLIPIIIMLIYFFLFNFEKKEMSYNDIFKRSVIRMLVEECREDLKYNQHSGTTANVYRNADFESFDRFKSEDNISGTSEEGHEINICEVHTEKEEKSKDTPTVYRTLFHGVFVYTEFEKYIPGEIKIRKNKSIKLLDMDEYLVMDSGEFEKIYDVYCKDKIVTMQILTADTMQMLMDFQKQNKIIPEITIKRNQLFLRFSTGSMFESNILGETIDYYTLKKYYDTINFTLEITKKLIKNIKETEF